MKTENLHNEEEDLNPDKLKEKAPFLFGIKKNEPYEAPDGYFEKFKFDLSDKIHTEPEKKLFWYFIFKPAVWVPAMVVVIAAGYFLTGKNNPEQMKQPEIQETAFNLEEISFEVLDAYVSDHLLAQTNTDELVELTGAENIQLGITPHENINEQKPQVNQVSEEEMEEYILENIEDFEMEI